MKACVRFDGRGTIGGGGKICRTCDVKVLSYIVITRSMEV